MTYFKRRKDSSFWNRSCLFLIIFYLGRFKYWHYMRMSFLSYFGKTSYNHMYYTLNDSIFFILYTEKIKTPTHIKLVLQRLHELYTLRGFYCDTVYKYSHLYRRITNVWKWYYRWKRSYFLSLWMNYYCSMRNSHEIWSFKKHTWNIYKWTWFSVRFKRKNRKKQYETPFLEKIKKFLTFNLKKLYFIY